MYNIAVVLAMENIAQYAEQCFFTNFLLYNSICVGLGPVNREILAHHMLLNWNHLYIINLLILFRDARGYERA